MKLSKTNVQTMSSLEIAKMTGKRHAEKLMIEAMNEA
jgi:phage regulator Rha-like protein